MSKKSPPVTVSSPEPESNAIRSKPRTSVPSSSTVPARLSPIEKLRFARLASN